MIKPSSHFYSTIFVAHLMMAASVSAAPVLWVDDSSGKLGKVDVATGAVTMVGDMGIAMTDIAFDPSGNLFGISFSKLYSINQVSAVPTLIGDLGTSLNSLVFSSIGTLYGANTSLYSIDTLTGHASNIGNGGVAYGSSGDLAFVNGNLYLSSTSPVSDSLIQIDKATGAGTNIGSIGVRNVFGMATNDNVHLYGVAGTSIYSIDPLTGYGDFLVNYGGHGLGAANGTAFFYESVSTVPEPEFYLMLLAGLGLLGYVVARRNKQEA